AEFFHAAPTQPLLQAGIADVGYKPSRSRCPICQCAFPAGPSLLRGPMVRSVAHFPMTFTEDLPFQALRRTWPPVGLASAYPPGHVGSYTLLDVELVVARFDDGGWLAADVACPHKGA